VVEAANSAAAVAVRANEDPTNPQVRIEMLQANYRAVVAGIQADSKLNSDQKTAAIAAAAKKLGEDLQAVQGSQ